MSNVLQFRVALVVLCLTARVATSQAPVSEADGQLKRTSLRVQHPRCTHASFTSDGRFLVTTQRDSSRAFGGPGTIQVWESGTGNPIGNPIHLTDAVDWNPVVTPDNKYLAVRYRTGTEFPKREQRVEFWTLDNLKRAGDVVSLSGPNASVAFSSNGRMLSATSPPTRGNQPTTSKLQLWEIPSGKQIGDSWTVNSYVHGIAFRKGGTQVFLSGGATLLAAAGTVQCFDLTQGQLVGDPWPTGNVNLVLGPDDKHIMTQSRSTVTGVEPLGTVRRWDVAVGKPVGDSIRPQRTKTTSISALARGLRERSAIHTDARLAAVSTSDRTVEVFDLAEGRPLGSPLQHVEPVYYILFNTDGSHLLTASGAFSRSDGCWLWDVSSGKRLARVPVTGELVSATFHPDGKTVVTVNDEGEINAWDIQNPT